MWRLVWTLFGVICAYHWLDAYQTYLLLQFGCKEINPLVKLSMDQLGVIPGLLAIKLLGMTMLGVFLVHYQRTKRGGNKG